MLLQNLNAIERSLSADAVALRYARVVEFEQMLIGHNERVPVAHVHNAVIVEGGVALPLNITVAVDLMTANTLQPPVVYDVYCTSHFYKPLQLTATHSL